MSTSVDKIDTATWVVVIMIPEIKSLTAGYFLDLYEEH